MSTTTPTFTPRVIGETEKALNAILDRELAGTGLNEREWIALVVTVMSGGTVDRDRVVDRLVDGLKTSPAEAQAHIDGLAAAGLVEVAEQDGTTVVAITHAGRELHSRIGAAVTGITSRMWGDLPAEDLDTAGRVLSTILERANSELAAV
jgi:DNA-binding MarR family transcriptional regulator